LFLVCDEAAKLPLNYSLHNDDYYAEDSLAFVYSTSHGFYGVKKAKVFLDSGFAAPEIFLKLNEKLDAFSVLLSASMSEAAGLVERCKDSIESQENLAENSGVYSRSFKMALHGVNGKGFVFFAPGLKAAQDKLVSDEIEEVANVVRKYWGYAGDHVERAEKHFMRLNGTFGFRLDPEKVEKESKFHGFFVVFTTDPKMAPETAIHYTCLK
jgi:hypothetical protein